MKRTIIALSAVAALGVAGCGNSSVGHSTSSNPAITPAATALALAKAASALTSTAPALVKSGPVRTAPTQVRLLPINDKDPFRQLRQLTNSQIEHQLQWLADYIQVDGGGYKQMKEGIAADMFLVSRVTADGNSSAGLQELLVARQNLNVVISLPAQNLQDAAQSAHTLGGQQRDLSKAVDLLEAGRQYVRTMQAAIIKEHKSQ